MAAIHERRMSRQSEPREPPLCGPPRYSHAENACHVSSGVTIMTRGSSGMAGGQPPNRIPSEFSRVSSSDQNLLCGALALERGFVSRDQFIAAMRAWVVAKATPLDTILLERQFIEPDEHALLSAIVAEHSQQFAGDSAPSLAAIHLPEPVCRELEQIGDPDLTASIARLAQDSAPVRAPAASRSSITTASDAWHELPSGLDVVAPADRGPSAHTLDHSAAPRPNLESSQPVARRRTWAFAAIAILVVATIAATISAVREFERRRLAEETSHEQLEVLADERSKSQTSDDLFAQSHREAERLRQEQTRLTSSIAKLTNQQRELRDKAIALESSLETARQASRQQQEKLTAELARQSGLSQHERRCLDRARLGRMRSGRNRPRHRTFFPCL